MFITFEGGEGTGKSTQCKLLAEYFAKRDKEFILTREPGGSAFAEKIRSVIIEGVIGEDKLDPISQTLLFAAARTDHIEKIVKPALNDGKIVICDRFFDSTYVYQGVTQGVDKDFLKNLHVNTTGNLTPDLTFIMDANVEETLRRAVSRENEDDFFEQESLDFHRKLREGFLEVARNNNHRCKIIDALGSIEEISQKIILTIEEFSCR